MFKHEFGLRQKSLFWVFSMGLTDFWKNFLIIATFMAIGCLMGAKTIPFALLFGFYKSVPNSDKGLCAKIFLGNTKLLVELLWTTRNQTTFFITSNSNEVLLTCSNLSAKFYPLICVNLVIWKELNKWFLYLSVKSFFRDAVHSVQYSVFVIEMNCTSTLSRIFPILTQFTTQSILEEWVWKVHV